jgi:hypothetical protein
VERRARYISRSKGLRGYKKHNEGFHRFEKVKKPDHFTNITPDTDTIRRLELGGDAAEREKIANDGIHRALNILQVTFRRAYCRSCAVRKLCDGYKCSVDIGIKSGVLNKHRDRYIRPMPRPDKPLPLSLGKPSGKQRRILPRKALAGDEFLTFAEETQ